MLAADDTRFPWLAMAVPLARLNAALSGRYRMEGQLVEGAMATVDLRRGRKVTVRLLDGGEPEARSERFLAENFSEELWLRVPN